jgi:hypothetical protein
MADCGLDPLFELGLIAIEEGATTLESFRKKMRETLGEDYLDVEEGMGELFNAAMETSRNENPDSEYDLAGRVPTDAEAKLLKAEMSIAAMAELDEPLDHRDVYRLVHALILNGWEGEQAVMAEATRIIQQYDPGTTERDVRRAFVQYGHATHPSKDADKVALRELRALVRLQESIDRLRERLDPLRTGPQRDKLTRLVREKQKVLNALMRERAQLNPVPSHEKLASINETRVRRLENQIADLEEQIRTGKKPPAKGEPAPKTDEVRRLEAKRDALKDRLQEIEDAKKVPLTEDEIYNRLRRVQLKRELAEVERRMRENDYQKRERPAPPPLNEENKVISENLVRAKMALHERTMEWERSQWPWWKKGWDIVRQSINLSRAIITSVDLSAYLRQGGFLIMANPKLAFTTFMPMIRAFHKPENARAVNDEILSRKNSSLYQKAGLYLAEQDSAHPTRMEEVYMGRWQEKVPLVAGSGRAYVTFLNRLRADTFDKMVDALYRKGQEPSIEELKSIAAYVNTATGRSKMGPNNRFAVQGMSDIFFAPRWMISRFSMALGLPLFTASPRIRKQIAMHYVNYAAAYMGLMALAAFFYGDEDEPPIEWDPRSTDFGKLQIGNTRLDMMSGLAQPIVLMSRLLMGTRKTLKGDIVAMRDSWTPFYDGEPKGIFNRGSMATLGYFLWGKASPMAGAIYNTIEGENVIGQSSEERAKFMTEVLGIPEDIATFPVVLEGTNMLIPLSIRDFADAAEEHGIPKAMAMQILATLGVSMNTYTPRPEKTKKKGRKKKRAPIYTGKKRES